MPAFNKALKKSIVTFMICLFLTGVVVYIDEKGGFKPLERGVNDLMLSARPREDMPINKDIILVGMDDESIDRIGRWPWNRSVFAEFLRFIKRGEPAAVLFDIEFLEKFHRNSKAEKYHLYDQLELWYESLPLEAKNLFDERTDETIIKLIADYRQYLSEPRPFADQSITDDDFFAKSLKISKNIYLAMHFTDDYFYLLPGLLESKERFAETFLKIPQINRNELYKDFLIYSKLTEDFTISADKIAEMTRVELKYVKAKIFDIRNFHLQYCADRIINSFIAQGSTEIDFKMVRNEILKSIKAASEIDLIKKDIFLGIEDIITSRLDYFNNVKLIYERDSVELPESVANYFRNVERPSFPTLPVTELLENTAHIGFANNNPDDDGTYRRYPLFFEVNGRFIAQLSLKAAEKIMKLDFKKSAIEGNTLVIPVNAPEFISKIGPELRVPLNEDKTATFNWAAPYGTPGCYKNASFYTHFFNLMQIEKRVYLFLAESLFESVDEKCIHFFRVYHKIRQNGLNAETIEELKPLFPNIIDGVDEMIKNVVNSFSRPNLTLERIKRLREKTNDLYMVKHQLNSFLKNIVGKDNTIDNLKGKILIIGLTAHATSDIKPTPVSAETPMFFGHANIINSFMNNKFIKHADGFYNKMIIFFMALFSFTTLDILHPGKALLIAILTSAAYFYFAFFIFCKSGVFIIILPVIAILLLNFSGVNLFFYFYEEREKRFVRQAFSHYLSPNAMEEILSDPDNLKLKGEVRVLTVLFSDIRSFTTFSENHTPEQVVAMLNEYLDYMTEIIFKYKGTLDKYVGDEIMAVYGAPSRVLQTDHCARALFTCVEMMDVLGDLQKKWVSEKKQPVDIGIGFNTGEMIVGNMGSKKHFDYTVIGDNVNLGARVEALTRNYNNHIIFTEFCLEHLEGLCTYKFLDTIKVKGKNKPVSIYEPLELTEKGIEEMKKFGPRISV